MRVWVTRAEPGATRTAEALRGRGHEPLVAPVLELRPLAAPDLKLEGVGAIAFTSRNAAAAFADLSPERGLPVFAVGDATARAARDSGFIEVHSADGDVGALARLIAAETRRIEGEVLHPSAREPAGDLAGALAHEGVRVRTVPVYETVAVKGLPAAADEALPGLDAVLVHSPKAGKALGRLLDRRPGLARLCGFGLSPACLEPLRDLGFARLASAVAPREDALLDLLGP